MGNLASQEMQMFARALAPQRWKQALRQKLAPSPLRLLAAVLMAIITLVPAYRTSLSQGITGSITGTVTDSSGAVVPGAAVTIRNVDTNIARAVQSSDVGLYRVTQLPPGNYSVKTEKNGFNTFEQKGIVLQIDQVVVINPVLKVGSVQQIVEVTTEAPILQTEQSSLGLVLDNNNIKNTPLNGRLTLLGLMILAPGVQNLATAQDTVPSTGVTLSVGSTRRNSYGSMATTLDGTVNEEVALQRSLPEVPSLDALDQFKIITSNAPAEFAQQAQIIVASKSGVNKFHGELLEFNRSKGLNAKTNSFVSRATTAARAPYERNEYGGNFSGPVVVPHFYNGRDRSFFFAAYEGYRYTFSSSANTVQPSAKMRDGDFSEFLSGGACYNSSLGEVHIVNPLTGVDYSQTNSNKIPSSALNSVSQQLLKDLYPNATTSGCYSTNTYETISYTQNAQRFSMRLDHRLSDKDQFRGTFMRAFFGPYPSGWTDSMTGGYSAIGEHNVDSIIGWTHVFSPSLVLDVPASYLHLLVVRLPHVNTIDFSAFVSGLGTTKNSGSPSITISNPSSNKYGGSLATTGDSGGGHPGLEQDIQFSPTLTKVFSKHTVKAGFSFIYTNYYDTSLVSAGSFSFKSAFSGDSFADFLLGVPTSTANGSPSGEYPRRLIGTQYGAFIQDDWKVLPKLTVNYGLRYDQQRFDADHYGRNDLFIPEQKKVVVFGNSIPSSAVSTWVSQLQSGNMIETSATAGMSSNPWDYLNQPNPNFGPRLGFAYEILPKTVLRGGFGIYFNLLATQYMATWWGQVPFKGTASYTNSSTAYNGSYFTMSNPFVTAGTYSSNYEIDAQAKTKTPYSETYNLAIERELPGGFGLRISYAGQHNVKQNNNGQTSYVNLNRNASALRVYSSSNTLQASYPYQPLNSVYLQDYSYYHTSLNSLQVGAHKNYRSGSSVNAEFQWTRILGIESFMDTTAANTSDSYGPVGGTTPLVLNMNYTYALPVGHGRWLLGNANKVVDNIFGGWQYSGVGTFQTGQPFSVTVTTPSYTAIGNATNRASRTPGVALYPTHKSKSQWFNPSAFTAPGTYTGSDGYTYAAYGNSGYDMLRGPAWWNLDMNLIKNIKWSEHYNLQLRADSFNTFNHPNLGSPAANISSTSSVGKITSNSNPPVYEARSVEFGAKFTF